MVHSNGNGNLLFQLLNVCNWVDPYLLSGTLLQFQCVINSSHKKTVLDVRIKKQLISHFMVNNHEQKLMISDRR